MGKRSGQSGPKATAEAPSAGRNLDRLALARIVLLAGLLAGLLLSTRLWLTTRTFPHLPVAEFLGPFSPPWDVTVFALWIGALLAALVRPRWTWALGLGLGIAVLLALQDQVRWQPWFYLYLLGLAGFLIPKLPDDPRRRAGVLAILQMLLVAMYFWSGWHKTSPGFRQLFESAFLEPLAQSWPGALHRLLAVTGSAVPWLEIFTAIALLTPRLRKAGVVLAIATHLFILLLIGPLGTNSNTVVWPWNLAMAVLVVIVFWGNPIAWSALVTPAVRMVAAPVVILLGIMPAFSPGRWDRYLSFHLYSGHEERVMLVLPERHVDDLPVEYHRFLDRPEHAPGMRELNFRNWSYAELNVPFPAEERMNLAVARVLAALDLPDSPALFFYYDYEYRLEEWGWDRFSPAEMRRLRRFPNPPLPYGNPTAGQQ